LKWSTVGVVVHECGVDAEGVADPERFQVGFDGVTDEDGSGAGVACEDGSEVGLDPGEGRRGHGERCLGGACPSRWSVVCVHREDERENDTL
jgi:hypothetical protein